MVILISARDQLLADVEAYLDEVEGALPGMAARSTLPLNK